jgi:hypothetical protein
MHKSLKINWHKSSNFGDQLNPYLVKKMWGLDSFKIKEGQNEPHLMMIGSILNEANSSSLVMGSGFVDSDRKFNGFPKFITVRGKNTLNVLNDRGFNNSIGIGDPAILMPDYFSPIVSNKKYDIGIIPHLIDQGYVFEKFRRIRKSKVINLRLKDDEFVGIESIINTICSCRCIISSSLHGLIIAHAYGIPGIWCEFSDGVIGNGFKFKDYFSGHSKDENIPYLNLKYKETDIDVEDIKNQASNFIIDTNIEMGHMRKIKDDVHSIITDSSLKYLT